MTSDSHVARVPSPSVGACFHHAWDTFLDHLGVLLVLGLITAAAVFIGESMARASGLVGLVGVGFFFFVSKPLQWGFHYLCLRAVRETAVEPEHLSRVSDNYREVVLGGFLVTAGVLVGLVFLIVPGLIFYLRTRFVPYLVVEEGMQAVPAIRESFRLTRDHVGTLAGIWICGLLASIVGAAAFLIGIVPAAILWDLSNASLYHSEVAPPDHDEVESFYPFG